MGCQFKNMRVSGKLSRKEVEAEFENAQEQDRYENGHSYSGGFGMASGLTFSERTFTIHQEAYDFLDENCPKWGDAFAVRVTPLEGEWYWLIGANCAS